MSKEEALKTMARDPERYAAIKNAQYIYFICNGPNYIIRLVDGKIDAYGREGDFDLTKDKPLINIKTESHIKKDVIIRHEEKKSAR